MEVGYANDVLEIVKEYAMEVSYAPRACDGQKLHIRLEADSMTCSADRCDMHC